MYVTTLPRASRNPGLAGFLFGCRSAGLGWGNKRRPGGLGQLDAPTIDIGAHTIAGPLDISSPAPLARSLPFSARPSFPRRIILRPRRRIFQPPYPRSLPGSRNSRNSRPWREA